MFKCYLLCLSEVCLCVRVLLLAANCAVRVCILPVGDLLELWGGWHLAMFVCLFILVG